MYAKTAKGVLYMNHYAKKFLKIFLITVAVGILVVGIAFLGAVFGLWGSVDELDVESLTLNQNSVIVYIDSKTGKEVELQKISSGENRDWVDIANIPDDLQKAFISIEDERFMDHKGFDFPRTVKATLTYIGNKIIGRDGVSLGGSTITQQLIKNVTGERDQTPVRKIREISRAVALEKEYDKSQILELYLNCIYLSRGCNGVQTAAKAYFGKDVAELNLAECASLAGITQNPAAYDPIDNPENNKKRQELVLGKMLELGHISQSDYDEAVSFKLKFAGGDASDSDEPKTTSYFVDQVICDVLADLTAQGYSKALAEKILYSGGVKIYASYNPEIQKIVEDFYADSSNFPNSGIQSAITILDVQTGQIVGIAGGIGEKTAALTLNRASQSPRQPGSSIKPLAAYAPAIENHYITPGSIFADKATDYNGWTPRNYDRQYHGNVDVTEAVRRSYNTVPVEIISRMGAQTSFDFLTENLGITSLVESREVDGKIYSDIGLSQLGLGGLTDGITTLEMAAAYAPFANGGLYYKPYTYTEVKDKDGNVILSSEHSGKPAMKASTAYTMTGLLKEVVASGTGGGAGVTGVKYTAGKTGTTTDDKDRWFVGYTPYYVAAIWYGYDTPKEIYVSGNPCITIFRKIMNSAHRTLDDRSRDIERSDDFVRVSCCTHSGMRATSKCPGSTYSYFESDDLPAYCNSNHKGALYLETEDEEEEEEKTDTEETTNDRAEGSGTAASNGSSSSSSASTSASSGNNQASSGKTPNGITKLEE